MKEQEAKEEEERSCRLITVVSTPLHPNEHRQAQAKGATGKQVRASKSAGKRSWEGPLPRHFVYESCGCIARSVEGICRIEAGGVCESRGSV